MSPASTPAEAQAAIPRSGFAAQMGSLFGRSLFPWVALALIGGTVLWGPWVTLILAIVWWKIVTQIG